MNCGIGCRSSCGCILSDSRKCPTDVDSIFKARVSTVYKVAASIAAGCIILKFAIQQLLIAEVAPSDIYPDFTTIVRVINSRWIHSDLPRPLRWVVCVNGIKLVNDLCQEGSMLVGSPVASKLIRSGTNALLVAEGLCCRIITVSLCGTSEPRRVNIAHPTKTATWVSSKDSIEAVFSQVLMVVHTTSA